jgi:class 3 adenylate cyclase
MPKEWSDFYARSGDLAFTSGDFPVAEAMYRKDIATITELKYGDTEALVREEAYAHRNVGKALLALHHFLPAAGAYGLSSKLFQKVQDRIGAFYSQCQQCRSEIRGERYDKAKQLLGGLETFVEENPTRIKERGIIHMLQAHIAWFKGKNALEARRLIQMAKQAFGTRRDHYYLFTLVLEARIFADTGDRPAARRVLFEAWRRSSSADMTDIRQDVETVLDSVGVQSSNVEDFDLTRLEQDCKEKGYVHADLTILYADIRGFTDASTRIDAHRMASFIGEFAKLVSTSVARNDGLPCRFLGDCVVALFGVRDEDEDQKVRLALGAVHEIYELFTGLRERWADHTQELAELGLGCGVATGTVVAGRFGAAGLLEFSVIGEPINLASRIQGKAEDGKVMLCQRTAEVARRSLNLEGKPETAELKGFGERTIHLVEVADVAALLRSRESLPTPVSPNIRPIASAVRNR